MAERPLLAADRVALAIREGRQTQDRRPVKGVFRHPLHGDHDCIKDWDGLPTRLDLFAQMDDAPDLAPWQPGDLLYVREACRINGWANGCEYNVEFRAGGSKSDVPFLDDAYDVDLMERWVEKSCALLDAREQPRDQYGRYDFSAGNPLPWRPNILMPRCVARTWVRVSRVWVERVRDISEADARAEGFEDWAEFGAWWANQYGGRAWWTNPYVWCCEFEREEQGR